MNSGGRRGEALRIVQIETRYVETDAINFRAVVQSLTGKNASTAWVGDGSSLAAAAGLEMKQGGMAQDHCATVKSEQGTGDGNKGNIVSSTTLQNMSFKDFDRLLLEFPPMEDLPWLL